MKTKPNALVHALVQEVNTHGQLVLQGMAALATVRDAIVQLSEASGFRLLFDPGSDATLVDYLAVPAARALEVGVVGGALGLLVGALLEGPFQGALLGLCLGTALGAADGAAQVRRGWRVSATWLSDGVPVITITQERVGT